MKCVWLLGNKLVVARSPQWQCCCCCVFLLTTLRMSYWIPQFMVIWILLRVLLKHFFKPSLVLMWVLSPRSIHVVYTVLLEGCHTLTQGEFTVMTYLLASLPRKVPIRPTQRTVRWQSMTYTCTYMQVSKSSYLSLVLQDRLVHTYVYMLITVM